MNLDGISELRYVGMSYGERVFCAEPKDVCSKCNHENCNAKTEYIWLRRAWEKTASKAEIEEEQRQTELRETMLSAFDSIAGRGRGEW